MNNLFSFKDRDGHYIIRFFGIKLSVKHGCNFKYKPIYAYGLTKEKRNPQLIVSLTSFPSRINYVDKTINTLLNQTLKADRIILWLAEEQFKNKNEDIPNELLKLLEYGLEIKWCKDIKSLKKLLPSLQEFPNDIIITADDDLYYEKNWLEKLYKAYLKDKKNIYVHRIARLKPNGDYVIKCREKEIKIPCHTKASYFNSPFGGSGCLYPPKCLSDEIFNLENYKKLANNADDLWFWAMAVLNGTKLCEVSGKKSNFYIIDGTEADALCKLNKTRDFNKIYADLIDAYPKIKENLKEEINEQNFGSNSNFAKK